MNRFTLETTVRFIPALASTAVFVTSFALLLIWLALPQFKEFSAQTMKANTTLGLMLASVAFLLLQSVSAAQKEKSWKNALGFLLTGVILFLGLTTGLQYLVDQNFGIDEMLATDFRNAESSRHPGRMSPIASVCFVLLSLGLLSLKMRPEHARHFSTVFVVPLLGISSFVLVGYLFGERTFYQIGPFIRIAPISAMCFSALSLGILFSRPFFGPVRILTSSGFGGMTARNLLPVVISTTLLLGLALLQSLRMEIVTRELGVSLFVLAEVLVLIAVITITAQRLDILDFQGKKLTERERKIHKRFMEVLNHAPLIVWALNKDGKYILSEGRGLKELGYQPSEVNGLTHSDLHRDHPEAVKLVQRALEGEAFTHEVEIGNRVYSTSYVPNVGSQGEIEGISAVSTDITDAKRAERDLRAQRNTLEVVTSNAASCLFLMDSSGVATYLNPAAEKVTGFSLTELTDRPLHDYIHHHRVDGKVYPLEECPLGLALQKSTFLQEQEEMFIRKDGSFFPVRYSIAPILHEGALIGAVLEFRDVTVEKKAEQALHDAIRARDEFLSIASHELKTPLTSLKLQAQLFQRKLKKGDESIYNKEKVNALVDLMDKQITRLARLVDDMLDISRIRSGKLTLEREETDLVELVQDVLERMKPQFSVTGPHIPTLNTACEKAEGRWDRMRIEQVVVNLLTNTIRYGKGEPVHIRVSSQDSRVRLAITDHGIGIAVENLEKIFHRFERVGNANEVTGLGLGLFITKQIVIAHGGRIWVESEFGKGSTFFVELPMA